MTDQARSGEDDSPQPVDEEITARNTRLLKRTVYIMGVLLVAGTIVLVAAIIWKASQLPAAAQRGFDTLDVAVPAGAAVRSVDIVGDRMTVAVEAGQASEIIIIDLRRGQVHGRVRLRPGAPSAAE